MDKNDLFDTDILHEKMTEYLDDFKKIYDVRPLKDNTGGMNSSHLFSCYVFLKSINPKYIIESGVWYGQGTWFFKSVLPNVKIVSIDTNPECRKLDIVDTVYLNSDIMNNECLSYINPIETLLFVDDHQPSLSRIKWAHEHNIPYVVIEDNYPNNQGDCYSAKKIISKQPFIISNPESTTWYEHSITDYASFWNIVEKYVEFPPIFWDNITTRWGTDAKQYNTVPLLNDDYKNKYLEFWQERKDYTWISLIKIKQKY